MKTIIGDLSLHHEGYGFVVPIKRGEPDVFIPARHVGDALHGDRVEADVRPSRQGLFEGKVTKVLEHKLKQYVGKLEKQRGQWIVQSEDPRIRKHLVLKGDLQNCVEGDHVVAQINQYPAGESPFTGTILRALPKRGSLLNEIEFVIAKHQLPIAFPYEVEAEAKDWKRRYPEILAEELKNPERKDLRKLPFVTIDGDDAKDFDDAICAEPIEGGKIRLWVAIADVAYFVRPGSAINEEAFARGTSVYFPGRVLPMLPEALSNDLCSLVPEQERLAFCAEMDLDANGEVVRSSFYRAVFVSHARLTYKIVKQILEDREPAVRDQYTVLLPMLETLETLAKRLKMKRQNRGSLDFDLPEPEIVLDFTGGIEQIEKSVRWFSHQLIEELMIAANEAVATFLTAKKAGCVYRVHEPPNAEKIARFHHLISSLGYKTKLSNLFSTKGLGKVIPFFRGHAEERLVNTMLLRSMSQAIYSPEHQGHFGLASTCYCHFTSPIRRYPDLITHRLLAGALSKERRKLYGFEDLLKMSEFCSVQERRAMEAEREMLALHSALFMKEKVHEMFEGVISHVTKFGFFVELLEYFVEGLVAKTTLTDDLYVFDEERLALRGKKRNKTFRIGERVRVQVVEPNLMERRVYFKLV